jgi:Transposase
LVNHFDGIAAYCDHPVRFGVVESINTTIKAMLRRARGMREERMLLLKPKWATTRPIRFIPRLGALSEPSTCVLKSVKNPQTSVAEREGTNLRPTSMSTPRQSAPRFINTRVHLETSEPLLLYPYVRCGRF